MSLASLAEEIKVAVTTYMESIQPSYSVEALLTLTCENRLDPSDLFENGVAGLFIVPLLSNYNVAQSNRRERIKSVLKNQTVGVILSVPFKSTTPGDVSEWTEIEEMLNFREAIEDYITTHQWSCTIQSVESEPAIELNLDKRWYMGICEFTFEAMSC